MGSSALAIWAGRRRDRVDELYTAHAAVGGTSRGRRTATVQLNWALALRLAGEFQGYARDLHDESIDILVATAVTQNLQSVLQVTFALGRKLDQGNANPSSLQQDFSRLGVPILDRVKQADPRGDHLLKSLTDLNTARNAIAHSQPGKLASVLGGSPSLRLDHIKRWDVALKRLAVIIDRVTAVELASLTGGVLPW